MSYSPSSTSAVLIGKSACLSDLRSAAWQFAERENGATLGEENYDNLGTARRSRTVPGVSGGGDGGGLQVVEVSLSSQ